MDYKETVWINLPKYSDGYINGIKTFIKNAVSRFSVDNEISCPCKKCKNDKWYHEE